MAKQLIISLIEELLGEYVLNLSKENMQIAALRGKLQLKNVQLDGDLIGSHVLGAVGLPTQGLGVLSCWAKSMKLYIPLHAIETEPTRLEMAGVHLLCLPLLPATAHRQYGAGTSLDPRTSLRTRAKRSSLARYERNFLYGRIPGEGPPTRRIKNALKRAERKFQKTKRARSKSKSTVEGKEGQTNLLIDSDDEDVVMDMDISFLMEEKKSAVDVVPDSFILPHRNPFVKLREKIMRNIEINFTDVHFRCEVPEGGLDFCFNDTRSRPRSPKSQPKLSVDQRSFSFGFSFDNITIRTDQDRTEEQTENASVSSQGSKPKSIGSHIEIRHVIAEINNASIYWDDQPPLLVSESYILRNNDHNLSVTKVQTRISAVMRALVESQEPGEALRLTLQKSDAATPPRKNSATKQEEPIEIRPHDYCLKSFQAKVRATLGDRNAAGPMTLFAKFLPMNMDLQLNQDQFVQYSKLRSAMQSQQRFDTMLRQRPTKGPMEAPRQWWKYSIACVTTRLNSRVWEDVVKITRFRTRYIALTRKKFDFERNGFHRGLTERESAELLQIEDLLPIEALMAFHLLALRDVYESRKKRANIELDGMDDNLCISATPREKPKKRSLFRALSTGALLRRTPSRSLLANEDDTASHDTSVSAERNTITKSNVVEAINERLGKKQWHNTIQLEDAKLSITLKLGDQPIIRLELRANGSIRTFGPGRQEFNIDITQFEVFDPQDQMSFLNTHEIADRGKILMFEEIHKLQPQTKDEAWSSHEGNVTLPPPPPGIVCRLSAANRSSNLSLEVSAHPATLVWNKPCVDTVADFFASNATELQTEVTKQLRDMATPLARKALVALLSPSAITLNVYVAAPKVWFPVSSESAAGSIFLDAGKLRTSFSKKEGAKDTRWQVTARDIQVMFVRNSNREMRIRPLPTQVGSSQARSIIEPLYVQIDAVQKESAFDIPSWNPISQFKAMLSSAPSPFRKFDIAISPIRLNLVDAEVLARAIGKWYADGLVRVKQRNLNKSKFKRNGAGPPSPKLTKEKTGQVPSISQVASVSSVRFEKIEMYLEGHSKSRGQDCVGDDQSVATSFTDRLSEPRTRTYVVQLIGLTLGRISCNAVTRTKLLLSDASILRADEMQMGKLSNGKVPLDPQHKVLVRADNDMAAEAGRTQSQTLISPRTPSRSSKLGMSLEDDLSLGRWQLSPGNFSDSFESDPEEDSSHVLSVSSLHDRVQHLDEVEIDVNSVVLRITPTSLKDCAKALRRVLEVAQVVTKEMERKVHEEGRKARLEAANSNQNQSDQPGRPTTPVSEFGGPTENQEKVRSDSSLLLRVTLHEISILAGRPILPGGGQMLQRGMISNSSYAVIQVVSDALIMFQSVENADGSGSKTLHVSMDDLSASASTEFAIYSPASLSPMIGPTSAEFRVVYTTENLGCIISQDISLDCEELKACVAPQDLYIMTSVTERIMKRLSLEMHSSNGSYEFDQSPSRPARQGIMSYHKSGTGFATTIRVEVQRLTFVLLHAYRLKQGTRPLFDFSLSEVKGFFQGCMNALSGDLSSSLSLNHFNLDLADWESTIEPTDFSISIDQMPNEIVIDLSVPSALHANVTSAMLKDVSRVDFSLFRKKSKQNNNNNNNEGSVDLSALSTVGMRRALEAPSVSIVNASGLDILISPSNAVSMSTDSRPLEIFVSAGSEELLDSFFPGRELERSADLMSNAGPTLVLSLSPSAVAQVGDRDNIAGLPVSNSFGQNSMVYKLEPAHANQTNEQKMSQALNGRSSPTGTTISDISASTHTETAYYQAEPVVEWCMQNQRLRSSISDVYSLSAGRDILSSNVWSLQDDDSDRPEYALSTESMLSMTESVDIDANSQDSAKLRSPQRKPRPMMTAKPTLRDNWLRPYLKHDSPEWTDMTCILRMDRDRVMLPDNNWMWLNDWRVDLSGSYGDSTDCDGWEYEADFETFNRKRRFYKRGDCCRRRRWTRTRMIKPPPLTDPNRSLRIVWETARDENENYVITVKSHVTIHNNTGIPLSCSVSSPSWDEVNIGTVQPDGHVNVPVRYASATYLRIGAYKGSTPPGREARSNETVVSSKKILIVPTGHNSNTLARTVIDVGAKSNDDSSSSWSRMKHFVVFLSCNRGIIDVKIQPVVRVINLLPCQLQCEVGEVVPSWDESSGDTRKRLVIGPKGRKVTGTENLRIDSGKEGKFTSVNVRSKPHISLRVPGYKWSSWHRIVNRKSNSNTWFPTETEGDFHVQSNEGDADFADEFKSIVFFERAGSGGDPLNLIVSVEMGHCPVLRIYAQYWILDKTGFGCRFTDSFHDLLGSSPESETSRRSYLPEADASHKDIVKDFTIPGHQWSLGMDGMSFYFSRKEKISLAIQNVASSSDAKTAVSQWVSTMDISNVIPKTVFSVDEYSGYRRFELAISVTVCPSMFARTRLITLYPRYQIVNLLNSNLIVAQDGTLGDKVSIPPRSSVPYHWERQSSPPKVRLGHSLSGNLSEDDCLWTSGCIQLDKIGITSMRFPFERGRSMQPMVVQAEVRLATKDQSSAVVVVVWSTDAKSNPLYVLRNQTNRTIICRQPLQDDVGDFGDNGSNFVCAPAAAGGGQDPTFECGTDLGPMLTSLLGLESVHEFVWVIQPHESACFGFDDPEKVHILEWNCVDTTVSRFDRRQRNAYVEVDAMGSSSTLIMADGGEIRCQIRAEHSTKVIEFTDVGKRSKKSPFSRHIVDKLRKNGMSYEDMLEEDKTDLHVSRDTLESCDEDEDLAFRIRAKLPLIAVSVVDNSNPSVYGREILFVQLDQFMFETSQNHEGYHQFEVTLHSLQVDNHVKKSIHPVLLFCPKLDENEPLVHMSAVRRLQPSSSSSVFRYAAIRILDIEIYLDRRTAESIGSFIQPIGESNEVQNLDACSWVGDLTARMVASLEKGNKRASRDVEMIVETANSGRIYFEQLHLHPIKIGLTFTQEWMEWKPGGETIMIFQFIRGMASIANAPLKFTSFMVGHVFESPHALVRIVQTHYASQLTKQIFGIVGSLAILGAPADFISNVGTGVRDFFYEPINGLVHGPSQFIEGLEAGTQSLARGVFVGVVRGAANVTEVVNTNLAGLTADDDFIDERKAHQRMLTDAMSRGETNRTMSDSLYLAGASVARGVKSGALGIWEQPTLYASKHGPVGFVKGVGKALVGAIVKPVVGVGDAAVLVMNHVSDATSDKQIIPKIPKRLRRALPRAALDKPFLVKLLPFDDRAAKAQKIVTGGESVDDVYIGHVNTPNHLIIASDQCLWAIDKTTRDPWCVSWEEISHFGMQENDRMKITVFSQSGLKSCLYGVEDSIQFACLYKLLAMQVGKMGNSTNNLMEFDSSLLHGGLENIASYNIPGMKARQVNHLFGSRNTHRKRLHSSIKDEIDVIEQCFARVKDIGSDSSTFFQILDEEAWNLVNSWGLVFSGLSSRRCIAASIINGTGMDIQIKSTKLVEGGSPCYSIPTKEYDSVQGVLRPGGAIIFFGWGVVPNLLQAGNVFMSIETNAFMSELSDHKSRDTYAEAMSGYQVGFLEKSYDEIGWWAKYWLLVRKL